MKNKLMRLASTMLVLTLLSTCVVSGTYAKYVTTATATDTARVAKFGVEIQTWTNRLFKEQYDSDSAYTGNTVENKQEVGIKNLVAPGTKSNGDISFTVTGKPEVAVEVSYKLDIKENVYVPAGTYTDYTTADVSNDTFTSDQPYYPVKFTLQQGGEDVLGCTNVDLTTIQNYLQTTATKQYAPGTDLSGTEGVKGYTLSWKWDFEDTNVTNVNKLDTLLGQVAAGVENGYPNVVTDLDFDLTISVTQID